MTAEQIKAIVQIVLKFNPKLWEKDSLTSLLASPVYLETMLSLFIGHGKWVKNQLDSPLSYLYEGKVKNPATDDQHRQLWSMISTACPWKFLSDVDITTFIDQAHHDSSKFEIDFANFVNRSIALADWMGDRLVHEGLDKKTFSKFLNHHKRLRLLMRSWVRGSRIDVQTPFKERFTMFKASSMLEGAGPQRDLMSDIAAVLHELGKGEKTGDRILRSAGAFTLQQFELLPTHLWVGRRVFALADVIGKSREGTACVPCIDCTDCDGLNGRLPSGEIQWIDVDKRISDKDFFLEFTH